MNGFYDPILVGLSYVIAALASYAALTLAGRMSIAQGRAKAYWLAGGASAMGTGIWSMHFVGMLAFHLPLSVSYAVRGTVISLLIAISVSGFALFTLGRETLRTPRLLASAILMGLGISAMHYSGMSAMEINPGITYRWSIVLASVGIAIVASLAALKIAYHLRSTAKTGLIGKRIGSAMVMGLAIAGMHYTGMAAARFSLGSVCFGSPSRLSNIALACLLGMFTFALLALTMLVNADDQPRRTGLQRLLGIRMKLAASYLLVAALVAASTLTTLRIQFESAKSSVATQGEALGQVMKSALGDNATHNVNALQHTLSQFVGTQARSVFVVDRNVRVIADSEETRIGRELSEEMRQPIVAAFSDRKIHTFIERRDFPAADVLQVVVPIVQFNRDPESALDGALVLNYSPVSDAILGYAHDAAYFVTLLSVSFVLLIAALGLHIAAKISAPLAQLERGASELAAGRYDARVEVDSNDEIGTLAMAFNAMAKDLSVSHQELLDHQAELESRVIERTMEWRRAEQAQRESAAELLLITEHMPAALCYVDSNLRYRFHNFQFAKKFNLSTDHIIGRTVEEVMGTEVFLAIRPYLSEALKGHEVTYERRHEVGQNQFKHVLTTLVPRHGEDGDVRGYYAMSQDISTRKRAEEELIAANFELTDANRRLQETQNQLLQAEKMASIGQLAAGVAHEINNPIGYIQSNLVTLDRYVADIFSVLNHYEELDPLIEDQGIQRALARCKDQADLDFVRQDIVTLLSQSREGIHRVTTIVRDLKNFSRSSSNAVWEWSDLHAGIDSTLGIVWNEIKYKAEVVKCYGQLPLVCCHLSQLNQVFLNILMNAAHAIEQQGTIRIASGTEGETVWISIADTGGGISEDHLKRIFDPFFTTKPVGQGTGLGLALSYGIIEAHHGRIEVETALGQGTTFKIILPIHQPDQDALDELLESHTMAPEEEALVMASR